MWIKQLLGIRSGPPIGSHAWILIAIFQLAMDFIICESGSPSTAYRYLQRPSLEHRIQNTALWNPKGRPKPRSQKYFWSPFTNLQQGGGSQLESQHLNLYHKDFDSSFSRNVPLQYSTGAKTLRSTQGLRDLLKITHLKRGKRQLQRRSWNNLRPFLDLESQPTTMSEFILWGPTGDDDFVESSTIPGIYETTRTSTTPARTTLVGTTTSTTSSTTTQSKDLTSQNPVVHRGKKTPGRISTTEPYPGNGKAARPPRIPNDTSGLAVHQIITITVSLIMVIAALITTLVLKNCCAQSGNARRNSHQRKINQQEESCQNLTDFTPARVPSNIDIFTAYNETLQCSHECVRTPVPVYATEETLHQTTAYKTAFNGNRPTSSDRHLIPVAFVSEKWFEISC
ncbi:PREDICTED: adherens junction-associated protein 1 isoform X1 [Nanorana parkeri]|uniref:adherens junction-associated protein 1 isoform X1 n=1 Tax=Nanorana parkeri TaxID=125878 RepID=UPI0008540E27|nr:PREDICTED: adherens junction-associated protein 1 isoform X1 [Nanorana parkeri]